MRVRSRSIHHIYTIQVKRACRPGCSSALLHMATKSILTLTDVVSMMDEQQAGF